MMQSPGDRARGIGRTLGCVAALAVLLVGSAAWLGCQDEQAQQQADQELATLRAEKAELTRQLDRAQAKAAQFEAKALEIARQLRAEQLVSDAARGADAEQAGKLEKLAAENETLAAANEAQQLQLDVLKGELEHLKGVIRLQLQEIERLRKGETTVGPTTEPDLFDAPSTAPDTPAP